MRTREPVLSHPAAQAARERREGNWRTRGTFALALAVGAALRLWQLAGKPGWQYDETIYTKVAANLLQHGTLNERPMVHTPWSPFLYQPPVYFLALARWFALTGISIYHARIFGVLCALAGLVLLWRLLARLHGEVTALAAVVPVIFDGWLLYIQRISYMENVTLLLIVASMLLYQRAADRPSWHRFALAGTLIGLTAVFKYTGAYIILAVLLCWLIRRREHKNHLILLGAFAMVAIAYVIVMARLFDAPAHDWFIQENEVQFRRVLGLQRSGGTLSSPTQALHLLFAQYRVFMPSLLLALASCAIAVRRLFRCYRARSWVPAQANALLFSWLIAGIVVFGLSSLRFPQYFALILVPLYCYLWTEMWQWDGRQQAKLAAISLAVIAGLGSFWLRVPTRDDNALAAVQRYAAAHIPAHATVITEETIGDLISQPWCRVEVPVACQYSATYAITWDTYLQTSSKQGGPVFDQMMQGATRLRSFTGFSGTATIWRLK